MREALAEEREDACEEALLYRSRKRARSRSASVARCAREAFVVRRSARVVWSWCIRVGRAMC